MTFSRQASASGQVRIGRGRYNIGRALAGRRLSVRLDADSYHWCFLDADDGSELSRKPAQGLDFSTLTGLQSDLARTPTTPVQLPLPLPVATNTLAGLLTVPDKVVTI